MLGPGGFASNALRWAGAVRAGRTVTAPSADERRVSPDVERVLGRPARASAQWARDNAVAFTWRERGTRGS
ncbi:hypothetical protein GCM10009634_77360 [Saccharothrix xinjiangensis]